jgi:hypothetical protein
MGGWLHGWLTGWLNGWVAGWLAEWVAGWVDSWLAWWVGGWLSGWVGCWMSAVNNVQRQVKFDDDKCEKDTLSATSRIQLYFTTTTTRTGTISCCSLARAQMPSFLLQFIHAQVCLCSLAQFCDNNSTIHTDTHTQHPMPCRSAFARKFCDNPRINTALAAAIRMAKRGEAGGQGGPGKPYVRINNESR